MAQPVPATVTMTETERDAYSRGRAHFDQGEIDPALEAFGSLLRTREGFADIHYMVGVLFDRKGDLEAAANSLRKAIRLNPSYAEALLALASIHEQRGDFDRSRELAERASSVSRGGAGAIDSTTLGKLANLQAAVGDAYAEVGDRREAIEAYRKALDRCPEFHDIRHKLGVTLRESGLPAQAATEFKRVLRTNPHLHDTRAQLGLTYYSLGRARDAQAEWSKVDTAIPGRADIAMYLQLVRDVPEPRQPTSTPDPIEPSE
jgi:tetratricopeptide (TPR) repeat protein